MAKKSYAHGHGELVHSTCRNPTLAKCGGEAQHSQSWGFGVLGDLESSGTPECLGFNSKVQNTSH